MSIYLFVYFKGIIRINEEVNKDAEHWIMLNLIVFSLFMRKFEATKDIFCAKLVFYICAQTKAHNKTKYYHIL